VGVALYDLESGGQVDYSGVVASGKKAVAEVAESFDAAPGALETLCEFRYKKRMLNLLKRLSPLIVLAVFTLAAWLLFRELKQFHLTDIRSAVTQVPASRILLAVLLTAANYAVLIGYDLIAVRSIGNNLPLRKVAFASFTGFVTSYNFGALLGGTSVRYRLYSAWGLSSIDIVRLVVMVGVTFWVGTFALAGVIFTLDPFPIPPKLNLPFDNVRPLGFVLLAIVTVYVLATSFRKKPFHIHNAEIHLPGLKTTLLQLLVAAIDLLFAAGTLYVLLPNGLGLAYPEFLGIYLLAMVAVVMSHVPGGVGVFELVLLTLAAAKTDENTVAALLVFRVVYYLFPLLIAFVMLAVNEFQQSKGTAVKVASQVTRAMGSVAPSMIALLTMLAGAILLWSGATPVIKARVGPLSETVPLPLVEVSHFLGSLFGVGLLLLARGLQRKLDSAYWMAVVLLIGGAVFSVLKGFDYEEAVFLCAILAVLLCARRRFYRRGSLLHQTFTTGWLAAILLTLTYSLWLGLFANKHVDYSSSLWWDFAFRGDAPRFMRASVGVVALLLIFAVRKLLSPQTSHVAATSPEDLESAAKVVATSSRTESNLALLGDKRFLFNDKRTAFLMYAVEGRSWVSLGDPIGTPEECRELVWEFREACDRFAARPVFYQVLPESLSMYLDAGFTLLKLGEEARVPLSDFSLEGSHRKDLRQAYNRGKREECQFEIIPAADVERLLPELKSISDAWLTHKHGREKGFSLGFFNETYLKRCPCAVVRKSGQIVAFANVWMTGDRSELSIDLMRYRPAPDKSAAPPDAGADPGTPAFAPTGVMEFLFAELMLWGTANGYQWFNLGMAPLSGISDRPLAPVWNRVTGLVFRHGDHFYSFEGLRSYKDKFRPIWTPKYLASPGGMALPTILADLMRLIGRERD
jgi:phosphatidylglycerol lysyltransferase